MGEQTCLEGLWVCCTDGTQVRIHDDNVLAVPHHHGIGCLHRRSAVNDGQIPRDMQAVVRPARQLTIVQQSAGLAPLAYLMTNKVQAVSSYAIGRAAGGVAQPHICPLPAKGAA